MILALLLAAASPDVLLVTIDTLRADRLGCYGYARAETPSLDRLAKEGLLLEDATVQSPQTRPSHASILTGLYPYSHGIRDNFSPPLRSDLPTLATVLAARGYDTGAFVGGYPVAAASGLLHGFATYDDRFPGAGAGLDTLGERRGAAVVDAALPWMRRARAKPSFTWIHLYDPHAPYEPPAPFRQRHPGRPYDGEVAYADAQVGRLLDLLQETGRRARTLVVVTSDHGEGLGDHAEDEHLIFLYDSTLHVPLLASWPGLLPAGRRVGGPFRSVDLLPTILGLLEVEAPPGDGASRATELRTGARLPASESYAETLYGQLHFGWAPLRALRAEGWKFVEAPRAELYDLRADPGELQNLLDVRSEVAARMRERLHGFDRGTAAAPAVLPPPDAGTLERLAALGYLAGGASGRPGVAGADPKDKASEHQAYACDVRDALRRLRGGDTDGALVVLRRLAQADSVSLEVQYFLGRALLRKGRDAEAAAALREAVDLVPRFAPAQVDLAEALRRQGKTGEAEAALEKSLALFPDNPALLEQRGLVRQQRHDLPGARTDLERARTLDPRALRAHLALSAVYRDQADLPRAIAELREAVRLDPRFVDGWNALGSLLAAAGRGVEAEAALRSALAVKPDDPDALFALAELLRASKRPAEAVALLERLQRIVPASREVAAALAAARAAAARP